MSNIDAAGYGLGGTVGAIALPPKVMAKIYKTYAQCSSMTKLASTEWEKTLGGDLTCHEEVVFPMLNGFSDSDSMDYQNNGAVEELGNPFSEGRVKVCQTWAFEKKFSRAQMDRMCDGGSWIRGGYETGIADFMKHKTDIYGMHKIVAGAATYNQGNHAGRLTHDVDLGSLAAPLPYRDGDSVEDILTNLMDVAAQSEVSCDLSGMVLMASTGIVAGLRRSQAAIACGCDGTNPKISGIVHKTNGFQIVETVHIPSRVNSAGKRVEYIALVDPKAIGTIMEVLYMEWQKIKHDEYFFGNMLFDTWVMNSKSVVVAAVTKS